MVPPAPDAAGRAVHHNPSLPTLSTLPDPTWVGHDPVPNAYGHPFRPVAMVLYPFGVAFNWVVVEPLYMLGGLAPEWFGMTTDDALGYHSHMPELVTSKDAPAPPLGIGGDRRSPAGVSESAGYASGGVPGGLAPRGTRALPDVGRPTGRARRGGR